MKFLELSGEDILNKEFDVAIKGYDAKQVDEFLDLIYKDYGNIDTLINGLKDEVTTLQEENYKLEKEIQKLLHSQVVSNEISPTDQVNTVDILKRLSKLEQEVYNNR